VIVERGQALPVLAPGVAHLVRDLERGAHELFNGFPALAAALYLEAIDAPAFVAVAQLEHLAALCRRLHTRRLALGFRAGALGGLLGFIRRRSGGRFRAAGGRFGFGCGGGASAGVSSPCGPSSKARAASRMRRTAAGPSPSWALFARSLKSVGALRVSW
jgi:hypothetical protein